MAPRGGLSATGHPAFPISGCSLVSHAPEFVGSGDVLPNQSGHIAPKRPSGGSLRANIRPFRASLSMPVEARRLHQCLASRAAKAYRSGGRIDMDEVKKRLESELNRTVERLRHMGGPVLSVDVM